MNKRTKPSSAQTGYKWVGWEVWDGKSFEEIIYKFVMVCQSWTKLPICSIRQITNMTYSKKRKIIFMVIFQMGRQICGNEYRNKWQILLNIFISKLLPFNTYLNIYNFSFFLKGFIQNSFLRLTSAYTCSTFYCFTIVTAQLNLKMSWSLTW